MADNITITATPSPEEAQSLVRLRLRSRIGAAPLHIYVDSASAAALEQHAGASYVQRVAAQDDAEVRDHADVIRTDAQTHMAQARGRIMRLCAEARASADPETRRLGAMILVWYVRIMR